MKNIGILSLPIALTLSLCAMNKEEKPVKENMETEFQPKPLDDDWNKWIIGEWEGVAESDVGSARVWMKIELGLNGQFLLMNSESKVTGTNEEQKNYYKDTLNATYEEIEEFKSSTFRGLQIFTIDPKSNEVVGYLFDSLRCVAKGRGKRQDNKEVIEWNWSVTAQGATSISTIERIDNDKFTLNNKYNLPNGDKMEDMIQMTRSDTAE